MNCVLLYTTMTIISHSKHTLAHTHTHTHTYAHTHTHTHTHRHTHTHTHTRTHTHTHTLQTSCKRSAAESLALCLLITGSSSGFFFINLSNMVRPCVSVCFEYTFVCAC